MEIFYDLNEFLQHRDEKSRIHYEILRESFNAGGLNGIKLYCILSTKAKEGHIIKYEEIHIIDPFVIDDSKKPLQEAMKEEYSRIIEEFEKKAKELNAIKGRWE